MIKMSQTKPLKASDQRLGGGFHAPIGLLSAMFHGIEQCILFLCLASVMLLPIAEALARRFFDAAIPQASTIVQHLVLLIAVCGGAIAARRGELLSLVRVSAGPGSPMWQSLARSVASGVGSAIALGLAYAGWQFLQIEQGSVVAGIPLEKLLWILPVGFGLIGWRLAWRSELRMVAFLCAMGGMALGLMAPWDERLLLWPLLGMVVVSAFFGMPIFALLGGVGILLFLSNGEPLAAISISQYDLAINPTLPAVPLFTLAGFFLAEGGASRRLVRLFRAWFGHLRGGAGVMTVLVCAFFTSFTGASGVTILALGMLLLPVLKDAGYSEQKSVGIITGAGSLGAIIPPCLPLLLYAIVASNAAVHYGIVVGIGEMFAAGLLPGALLAGLAMVVVTLQQPRREGARPGFSWREACGAAWDAKWELLLPVVAIAVLMTGLATPVEAAAVTALLALVSQSLVHRDFKRPHDLGRVIIDCGVLIGGILLILGVAMGLTNFLVDAQIPDTVVDWAKNSIASTLLFLLMLNLLLIAVGCIMDIFSALVIVVPIIVPVAIAFDVDLAHLGIIFLANLQLGYLTPPVGMNLYMASYRFDKPMGQVMLSVIPLLLVYAVGVLIITFVPALSTWFPSLLGQR